MNIYLMFIHILPRILQSIIRLLPYLIPFCEKKGMNSTLSGLFEYLLLQNDIKASHLINLETNSIAKMISMAEFNGQKIFL